MSNRATLKKTFVVDPLGVRRQVVELVEAAVKSQTSATGSKTTKRAAVAKTVNQPSKQDADEFADSEAATDPRAQGGDEQ